MAIFLFSVDNQPAITVMIFLIDLLFLVSVLYGRQRYMIRIAGRCLYCNTVRSLSSFPLYFYGQQAARIKLRAQELLEGNKDLLAEVEAQRNTSRLTLTDGRTLQQVS